MDVALRRACRQSFHGVARRWGVTVLALEFGPGHVHLFLGGCRRYSVSDLARHFNFRGASSRGLAREALGPGKT
jgi:REP element-mobilizing transposase RayT